MLLDSAEKTNFGQFFLQPSDIIRFNFAHPEIREAGWFGNAETICALEGKTNA